MEEARDAILMPVEDARIVRDIVGIAAYWVGRGQQGTRPLLDALVKAIGADHWKWTYSWIAPGEEMPTTIQYSHSDGIPIRMAIGYAMRFLVGVGGPDPASPSLKAGILRGRHFSITHRDAAGREAWATRPECERYRHQLRIQDIVHSFVPLEFAHNRMFFCSIGLIRRLGRPEFGEREQRIVHLVAEAMPWLRQIHQTKPPPEVMQNLSEYLRPLVPLMISGLSEKQIANVLSLPLSTTKTYRKRVLKAAKVASVHELAAKYSTGRILHTDDADHVQKVRSDD